MADDATPQIYLITPAEFELSRFPKVLASVLDATDVACVRLALASQDEDRIARAADALREVAHARDVAIVLGTHLGLVGPWYPKGWPEPELSWHLVEGAEGRGVAQEAAEAVLRWLFRDLGWASCASLIPHDNAGSIALAERLGARREGVFRHKMAGEMQIWRHVPRTAAGQRLIEDMQ